MFGDYNQNRKTYISPAKVAQTNSPIKAVQVVEEGFEQPKEVPLQSSESEYSSEEEFASEIVPRLTTESQVNRLSRHMVRDYVKAK